MQTDQTVNSLRPGGGSRGSRFPVAATAHGIAASIGSGKNMLAKNSQRKEEEIRELKETLQREKQEKDQLRREIDKNEHEKLQSKDIIEQLKVENDLLRTQRGEHFNQIQVANERRLVLEKKVF